MPFASAASAAIVHWWRPALLSITLILAVSLLDRSGGSFWTQVVTRALILAVFTLSVDLVWGYTGVFTIGHAIPFGVGGYAAGLLAKHYGWVELFPLLVGAGLMAGVIGAVTGAMLFLGRRPLTAIAVSLVTLALSFVAERVAFSWSLLGAANGLPGLPIPTVFGWRLSPGTPFFLFTLALAVVVWVAASWLVRSRAGLVMRAVRDDDVRASYLGYAAGRVRFVIFLVSNVLAGIAGALFALHEGFVGPTQVGVVLSTQVLLWLVLGGRGVLLGAFVGVAIVEVGGRRIADTYPRQWPVILGVLLLVFITVLPGGIVEGWRRLWGRLARRRPDDGPPALHDEDVTVGSVTR
jgi:branched-chain amino acid transport system permease protein